MEQLQRIATALENEASKQQMVIGFDGFIDEIIDVVDKRTSVLAYERVATIAEFGLRLQRAAGLSTNVELVPKVVKIGGNGPIMANALAALDNAITYIGALGKPLQPVFEDFAAKCSAVYSLADPGHTDALEFRDGKIMLGKLESLTQIRWDALLESLGGLAGLRPFFHSDLVATVNWTMTPYMNEIWQQLQSHLPPPKPGKKPLFFVDLADPQKRSPEEILEALGILRGFSNNYRVVLGLNQKEALEVAAALQLDLESPGAVNKQSGLEALVAAIAKELELWCLVVHPVDCAAAACDGQVFYADGAYALEPKLTTGAGDNFNAGFCYGLSAGLSVGDALFCGNATAGYYVRQAHSPDRKQLVDFLRRWSENRV